jgi:predicted membrane protein
MKMNFAIFFGVLVVLAGISILLDAVFHIHLPLVRTAVALFFIFFGVRILTGAWGTRDFVRASEGSVLMGDTRFAPTATADKLKYDIIFGRGIVDLTGLPRPEKPIDVEVNTVFGSAQIAIDPSWPVAIDGSAAFGDVRLPDQQRAAFGAAHYQNEPTSTQPLLRLKVNSVFSSAEVIQRGALPPPTMLPRPSH